MDLRAFLSVLSKHLKDINVSSNLIDRNNDQHEIFAQNFKLKEGFTYVKTFNKNFLF